MKSGKKRFLTANLLIFILAGLLFSSCAQGPSEDELYTVFLSYRSAVPTTESVTFEDGSTTEGVIVYNFDNVVEETYGYSFDGLVRDTFTADSHTYWGMLTCTGGTVTTMYLNYINTGGTFTGTISGDNASGIPSAIDLSTLDFSSVADTTDTGTPAE